MADVAYSSQIFGAPEFAAVRDRFDVVGFDPRGVGASDPVTCGPALHDPSVTDFPENIRAYDRLVAANFAAGRSCRTEPPTLVEHLNSDSVVEDIEWIRSALGEKRISWLGLSYGTLLGSRYAERYPDRVHRMVLDGVVDHQVPSTQAAIDEAAASEMAFERFARWCAAQGDRCPAGPDAGTSLERILAAADRHGVPAPPGRVVNAEEVTNGIYALLQQTTTWPELARAISEAGRTDGTADASRLVASASFTQPTYPAYRTIGCHDFAGSPDGGERFAAYTAAVRDVAPRMWRYTEFSEWVSGCAGWPVPPTSPPSPLSVSGVPPNLLVNTLYDAATPRQWARSLGGRIAGSRLLTVDGDGHTGFLNSGCARRAEAEYFVSGVLPPTGALCPAGEEIR